MYENFIFDPLFIARGPKQPPYTTNDRIKEKLQQTSDEVAGAASHPLIHVSAAAVVVCGPLFVVRAPESESGSEVV